MTNHGFHRLRGLAIFSDETEATDGGHAMVIVGYDDKQGAFKLLNSWGEVWGDQGYGWVSSRCKVLHRHPWSKYRCHRIAPRCGTAQWAGGLAFEEQDNSLSKIPFTLLADGTNLDLGVRYGGISRSDDL